MSFIRNSVQMLLWRGLTILLGTLTAIILARLLGPEARGSLAIIVLTISMMAIILQFGVPEALIYLLGANKYDRAKLLGTIYGFFSLTGLLLVVPTWYLLVYLFNFSNVHASLMVAATFVSKLLTLTRHVLMADKLFNRYSLSIVLEVSTNIVMVSLFWLYNALTLEVALLSYLISLCLALLLLTSFSSLFTFLSTFRVDGDIVSECLKRGVHYFFAGVSGFAVQRINFYILNSILGVKAVGQYTAANTLPTLMANIPQQLATVLYSHVSSDGSGQQSLHLTVSLVKVAALVSIVVLIPIIFFAEPLVVILFGQAFAGIGNAMIMLCIGMVCVGLGSLLFNSLAGLGYQKYGSHLAAINIFVISLLGYLFVPSWGLDGAALSQMFAGIANLTYILTIFCFKTKTSLFAFLTLHSSEQEWVRHLFKKLSHRCNE